MFQRPQNQYLYRLLAGWLGACLYLSVMSPVGFATAAVLGVLDSDHHLVTQATDLGPRLVLRHEGRCARHQHHTVARVLTLFARPTSAANPDHVLQFSSATCLAGDSNTACCLLNETAVTNVYFAGSGAQAVNRRVDPPLPPKPPPDHGAQLTCLRSTVLVI